MRSGYSDLSRPPLHEDGLRRALIRPDGLWRELTVVAEAGSTNADLAEAARDGAPEGVVLVAERQVAGRGRLGRRWESPARAGLAVSVLLRPGDAIPTARLGWLPLLAGVALAGSVQRITELPTELKWPNDLLVGGRKCAGILAESVPPSPGSGMPAAVVVGVGLNVSLTEDELPGPDATSLILAGAPTADRDPLLRALLRGLADWYGRWRAVGGDADACGLREAYRSLCATLGQQVRVPLPSDAILAGTASDVDGDGRLVVTDVSGRTTSVTSGDVIHVR